MTAESMLWLLLTGRVPSPEQSHQLSAELAEKGELPAFVEKLLDSYAFLPVTELRLILTFLCKAPEHSPPYDPTWHGCRRFESRQPVPGSI